MKKIFLYSLILFWWCLMFPSNSYTANINDCNTNSTSKSITINDKEIRFKLLDFINVKSM